MHVLHMQTEDNIRSNVANIEKQLGDLVGKVNRPEVTAATHQQLKVWPLPP